MKQNYTPSDDPCMPFGDRLKNSDGFVLPDAYFEDLAGRITKECPAIPIDEDTFQVPESYFESLSDKIMFQTEQNALPADVKNGVFKIPDGYFEDFQGRLMGQISKEKHSGSKTLSFRRVLMFSIAASMVLGVCVLVLRLFSPSADLDILSSCSEDELLEYVSTYSTEFNSEALASVMNNGDLNALDFIDKNNEDVEELLEYFE